MHFYSSMFIHFQSIVGLSLIMTIYGNVETIGKDNTEFPNCVYRKTMAETLIKCYYILGTVTNLFFLLKRLCGRAVSAP